MSIIIRNTYLVTFFIKTPYIYENMTMLRDFAKNTILGHADNNKYTVEFFLSSLNINWFTSTPQCPSKLLNPQQASLFDLLPTSILMDIGIWVYGLEHRNEFKHAVFRLKPICDPIIFAIHNNLWTSCHNVGSLLW